jgi:hypothetical protein
MTEPVDILAIAAIRMAAARQRLRGTQMLQAGPAAEVQYQAALLGMYQAEADMTAARNLGQLIEDAGREGQVEE